jgi:hypothetical protein
VLDTRDREDLSRVLGSGKQHPIALEKAAAK